MVLGAIARFDAQSRDRTTQFFVQYSQDITKLDAWGTISNPIASELILITRN